MDYQTIDQVIGQTPLVRLQRLAAGSNTVLVKLEGDNPAGSVKDRPALAMICEAEKRGEIRPGDTLLEATSGNTGIALAMVAAIRGYRMVLTMPENASRERVSVMRAYGAEVLLTPEADGMEGARDKAEAMDAAGEGRILNQFANPDNPLAHYEGTGPELWEQTGGAITHFVSSMGTTGTAMGVSRYLKEQSPAVSIIGVQPAEGAEIPGIRRWPEAYLPAIFDREALDEIVEVTTEEAETMTRQLAREEGLLCGVSSGGNVAAALKLAARVENALIVTVVCDRGDRYLSTGVFDEESA
ncbi:MAG: cysteine synthase CysM [Kiritimatiellae bacterium]|nr:cysteine synthase CysM [Kiritimatiellia bacterium]